MNASRPIGLALACLVALFGAASAQPVPPGSIPGSPPPGVRAPQPVFPNTPTAQGNPICVRLETALRQLDVPTGGDPDVLRRYDESINRQRVEVDQAIMQGRRLGCDSRGGFFLFGSLQRPPQCDQLNARIVQMRNNVDRMVAEVERLRGSDTGRDPQRRQLVAALAQNNCGPQYRAAAAPQQPQRPRGLFESLFGGPLREEASPDADPLQMPQSGAFRTVCVRTCDGFFFPISYATTQAKFAEDEQACRRLCPAAETELYYHRNPGEEIEQAVSTLGAPYMSLPTAFKYRQAIDPACACRGPGQTWSEALTGRRDATLQPGDIVVTEERARQLSQPKTATPQKATKGPRGTQPAVPEQPPVVERTPPPPEPTPAVTPTGERKVRVVGPQFYPVR